MSGVVAAGARETAQAGAEALRKGGNAVDAVIAASLASFVAEPVLAGAGGGGVMTLALSGREPAAIDFFSDMPGLGGSPDNLHFSAIELDFGPVRQEFHVGRGSAAVPGVLPGLARAHQLYGSLPLEELVAPAVRLAIEGVQVTPGSARVYSLIWPIFALDEYTCRSIIGGRKPVAGDWVHNPEFAEVLREFGALGRTPDRVIEGLLEHFGPSHGGLITEADVRHYQPRVCAPRREDLGEWSVYSSPAPGGGLALVILGQLAAGEPRGSEAEEVLRYGLASQAGHSQRRALTARGSTTHVSAVDTAGGAASVTLTNGEGCGYSIPGTGIQINNFLGEEDLNPDGFHQHVPGRRLPTMIAPSVGVRGGVPALALGSGGSNRIRSAVGQVLYRVVCRGQPVEHAVAAPRIHAEERRVWVELETLADPGAALAALRREFDEVHAFAERDFFFGGVHTVALDASGRPHGVGDTRRDGVAAR